VRRCAAASITLLLSPLKARLPHTLHLDATHRHTGSTPVNAHGRRGTRQPGADSCPNRWTPPPAAPSARGRWGHRRPGSRTDACACDLPLLLLVWLMQRAPAASEQRRARGAAARRGGPTTARHPWPLLAAGGVHVDVVRLPDLLIEEGGAYTLSAKDGCTITRGICRSLCLPRSGHVQGSA